MRAAGIAAVLAGLAALALLTLAEPAAAADGWRAGFLLLSALPLGAVALGLIARVVGADWEASLRPFWSFVPAAALLAGPVVIGQALFHRPAAGAHLSLWLSPGFFLARTAAALGFWWWLSRRLLGGDGAMAGPLLFAHGVVVSVMGYDWLLGASPAQPQSAAPMVLATMQLVGACGGACLLGLGRATVRRDLAYLLVASALGLAYLLYVDFVIVWFGNLPEHVGWYHDRLGPPASLIPGAALALGLILPALLVGLGRTERARAAAGGCALAALALVADWQVAGPGGWTALAAMLATVLLAGGAALAWTGGLRWEARA